jgi:hypothetical protein
VNTGWDELELLKDALRYLMMLRMSLFVAME